MLLLNEASIRPLFAHSVVKQQANLCFLKSECVLWAYYESSQL